MQNHRISIGFLLLLISCVAGADTEKICEDLQKFSCAPGAYDDGTGTAKNSSLASDEESVLSKVAKTAKERFRGPLANPENIYFRKLALSATGLGMNPDCDNAEESPKAACLDLLAEGCGNIAAKDLAKTSMASNYYSAAKPSSTAADQMFLTESPIFGEVRESLNKDLSNSVGQDNIDKKVKDKIFPEVKTALIAKLDKEIQDPDLKKRLIDKIKAIRYQGSDCTKNFSGSEGLPAILTPNAFYSQDQNVFKYCLGMTRQNTSEFQMAFVIAHELSHSIDPCGITMGPSDYSFTYKNPGTREVPEKTFPIPGVLNCLRKDESVGSMTATEYSTKQMARASMPGGMGYGGINYGYGGLNTAPAAPAFNGFCNHDDQITESFSDWMAAEVTPDYIEKNHPELSMKQKRLGYSNIWRGMCEKETGANPYVAFNNHPTQERRTNFIILMQPKIREQMGCPAKVSGRRYCEAKVTEQNDEAVSVDQYSNGQLTRGPREKKVDPPTTSKTVKEGQQ